MATGSLLSPGVQVTVTDNTVVTTAPTGTVPFVIVATAQDKINSSNVVAQYTTASTAGQVFLETSQRSLLNDFGVPFFENVEGTPVNASEQNEYGLQTAFSTLGVTDALYIMRAPIDLNAITGSKIPPTGVADKGTLWFDANNSSYGIFIWNAASQTFFPVLTTNPSGKGKLWVISNVDDTTQTFDSTLGDNFKPLATIGKPGDFAVVTVNSNNPVWYMTSAGTWNLVGSSEWQSGIPTVIGSQSNPTVSGNLILNGSNISLSNANVNEVASSIVSADLAGVSASVVNNRIAISVNDSAANSAVIVSPGSDVSVLSGLGITAATYYAPEYVNSNYINVPHWNSTDSTPEPSGSVWFNTSTQQNGSNLSIKSFNGSSWISEPVAVYNDDAAAIYGFDPIGGGINIPAGTLYAEAGSVDFTFEILERNSGISEVISANSEPSLNSEAYSFIVNSTSPGDSTFAGNVTIDFNGPAIANVISAINGSNVSGIEASLTSLGALVISNTNGGSFYLYDGDNTPLSALGIPVINGFLKVSNWVPATYVVATSSPVSDPTNGTIWYYDDPSAVDILIDTGSAWQSYKTVTANLEARGYNLTLTDPNGPIIGSSAPSTQSNGNALAYGDLWINVGDLDDLPSIYRYSTGNVWTAIDNADHTSPNGIIFADARWSSDGNSDPGLGNLVPISTLVSASPTVLDSDAPQAILYPRGTLLFNTRRSGMNVKQFETNYLTSGKYTDTWVTLSGNNESGVAYQGSAAQRNVVVQSMAGALANSSQILDSFYNFNLIAAPGYVELLPSLVTLNENRGETAFIVGDSPLTLKADANDLNIWANNLNNVPTDGIDGLVTTYDYAGVYYPSALTTDVNGNNIVVPSSYMALPTIIQSDAVSFPWFAPAGAQRGIVNNVNSLGYVDGQTGNFVTNSISQNLRDTLYPAFVNPITNFNTNGGIQVYGQKTRNGNDGSELSRINVARLVIYLKSALAQIGQNFVFEQNDSITRASFAQALASFLNGVQSNRGIFDYAISCNISNNPPSVVDANQLYADVAIAPTTVSEYILIPVTLLGSGVLTSSTVSTS